MKKQINIFITLIVLVILLMCTILGCIFTENYVENKRIQQAELSYKCSIADSVSYAWKFRLDSNMDLDVVFNETFLCTEKYTKISYAQNGAGIDKASEGEIIYYPSQQTESIIAKLNGYIQQNQLNITEFGLTYPITLDDILNHSCDIIRLVQNIDKMNYSYIFKDDI